MAETKTTKAPAKAAVKAAAEPKAQKASGKMIAAILVRDRAVGVRHDVRRALDNLRLWRKHICAVYPDTPTTRGMLVQCKDLITYGPISDEMLKKLGEKRGHLKTREGKILNVFRMHPPRGGWGRKGIKVSYQNGGCLGFRPKGMDAQLEKMM